MFRFCVPWLIAALGLVPALALSERTFTASDLVMLDRVSDPHLSPDGSSIVYQLRQTDLAANKGITSIWLLTGSGPAHALTPADSNSSPRWDSGGKTIYFLSGRSGSEQVWRLDLAGGEAQQVTRSVLDIGSFKLAPDGRHLAVAMDVFLDCDTPECTRQRLDERATRKASGRLYDQLFVRHWDAWADGTRSQLFIYTLDEHAIAQGAPVRITRGVDGDAPSKPFGDDAEYSFTPDSREVMFAARVAGRTEPWSTNFDVYRTKVDGTGTPQNLTADNPAWDSDPEVSPDGKTLAYTAMKRPGFEADRFGIMLKDLASGSTRELLPNWDRSAEQLQWSADGKTLYALADDMGQRRLYAVDVARARVSALTGPGTVQAYSVAGKSAGATAIVALDNLAAPTQLYRVKATAALQQLTHHDEDKLAGVALGAYEQFEFPGWNNESVHGYVVKPAGFQPGKKYPVAFLIHGGPEAPFGNTFHYRWNSQTFAGAGFAVVSIEFHGTPGYGQAFTDSIAEHWGDRPLEDLKKGWKYALERYPFLDATRACALGGSYGGYMINWIAGNWSTPESGAWKCLVDHDGIFDSHSMYYSTEELWFEERDHGGTPFAQPENYARFNPAAHAADWKVPMLVIHGGKDFRVPLEQGISSFTALQRRGIASQLLYFPDENHWVLKPQNSVQWYGSVLDWLKRWTASP